MRWCGLLLLLVACERTAPPAPPAPPAPTAAASPPAAPVEKAAEAENDAGPASSFGPPKIASRVSCGALGGKLVAERDLKTSFVDGEDLLALVNRSPTGALAPEWAPSDMVDLRDGTPKTPAECEKVQCLRKDAASALGELMAEMKKQGFPGKVESAFRSYGSQCGTFANWASKSSFCEATEQSALPGHSQHQLGTTVDLFTEEWSKHEKGVFRAGFGCTPAGRWLREHGAEFGFVMPYPIHADDRHPKQSCVVRWDIPVNINPRTGYRYEHWHFRYVGKEAAARFERMRSDEITVEQWLRAEKGLAGADAELPVCDGCNCGACSTLAAPGESACDKKGGALHLGEDGRPLASEAPPSIAAVMHKGRVVTVKLDVTPGIVTQTPVAPRYEAEATVESLSPYPGTTPRAFAALAGAWVVGIEPVPNTTGIAWPYRAALTEPRHAEIYNRANVLLPARPGRITVKVPLPRGVAEAKIVLLEGGTPRGEEQIVTFEAGSRAAP